MDDSDPDSISPLESGDVAGGLTAGTLSFLHAMALATVSIFSSPLAAGYFPVFLLHAVFWSVVAAMAGWIVGGIAAKTRRPLKGTLIGIAPGVAVAICSYVMFGQVVGAAVGVMGMVSGGAAG